MVRPYIDLKIIVFLEATFNFLVLSNTHNIVMIALIFTLNYMTYKWIIASTLTPGESESEKNRNYRVHQTHQISRLETQKHDTF